jgi:hypothetical protein
MLRIRNNAVRLSRAVSVQVEMLERRVLLTRTLDSGLDAAGLLYQPAAAAVAAPQSNNGHNKTVAGTPADSPSTDPFTEPVSAMEARDPSPPGSDGMEELPEGGEDDEAVDDRRALPRGQNRDATFAGSILSDGTTPDAPQTISSSFATLNLSNSGFIPPDTMGAVGPDHFVEVINGAVAVYTKTGTRLSLVSLDSFFNVTIGGETYPRGGGFDPRVLYDRRSGRFFATAMEFGTGDANGIVLAVSRTSDPTGVWDKYFLNVGVASAFTDYATLGVDDNGVYLGMTIFPDGGGGHAKIVATAKASLLSDTPSLSTVFGFDNITDMYSSPQPATNFDAVAPSGRAWFVSSSTTVFGNVNYRKLTWSDGTPSLSSSSSAVSTPGYGGNVNFTTSGSSTPIDAADDRLMMAVIRNNQLWTSRTIGVNSAGTNTAPINRDAAEWIELDVSSATASRIQSGRVFDSGASPRNYIYPSVMVNGQGHMAMGFSGGKAGEFMGFYTTGRLASDPLGTTEAITQIKAGTASYTQLDGSHRNRWGDYSYTSLDPNDDMSLWSIGEYTAGTNLWGTWTARLLAPAPALNDPSASGAQGQSGLVVNLTGAYLYDPGAGFASRLNVSFTGGATNGITVTNIVYNSPTSATVTLDIAAGASIGSRDILLTNPDGQSVTVTGGFTVNAGAATGGIAGQTYEDRNGNGTFDAGDVARNDITVFLDSDNSGTLNGDEPSVLTVGSGNYSFSALPAGTYHVRELVPSGFVATVPAGGAVDVVVADTVVTQNFGNFRIVFTGSAANDLYTVDRPATDTTRIEIVEALSGITYSAPASLIPSLTFDTGGGDDILNVITTRGAMPAGGITFTAGTQDTSAGDTLNITTTTGAETVAFNSASAELDGSTVNFTGVETRTFDGLGGLDDLSINAGSLLLRASQDLQSLLIADGAGATLAAGGDKVLATSAITITGSGQLDLTNNKLIFHSSGADRLDDAADVTALIKSGFNGAGTPWTGPGITSSLGGNGSSDSHALGVVLNDLAAAGGGGSGTLMSSFGGQTVGVNDILVRYTYFGDADLDGAVTTNDYFQIDNGFLDSRSGWINGDFDYDGSVTTNDYFVIDNAFLNQDTAAPTRVSPEPLGTAMPGENGLFAFAPAPVRAPRVAADHADKADDFSLVADLFD